jgi:hypothetical protein
LHLAEKDITEQLFDSTGSTVAVEQIFSSGHDTISIPRASLHPDSNQILMLVKQCLRLACTPIQEIFWDCNSYFEPQWLHYMTVIPVKQLSKELSACHHTV